MSIQPGRQKNKRIRTCQISALQLAKLYSVGIFLQPAKMSTKSRIARVETRAIHVGPAGEMKNLILKLITQYGAREELLLERKLECC